MDEIDVVRDWALQRAAAIQMYRMNPLLRKMLDEESEHDGLQATEVLSPLEREELQEAHRDMREVAG
jgi:hypothetical protein